MREHQAVSVLGKRIDKAVTRHSVEPVAETCRRDILASDLAYGWRIEHCCPKVRPAPRHRDDVRTVAAAHVDQVLHILEIDETRHVRIRLNRQLLHGVLENLFNIGIVRESLIKSRLVAGKFLDIAPGRL